MIIINSNLLFNKIDLHARNEKIIFHTSAQLRYRLVVLC